MQIVSGINKVIYVKSTTGVFQIMNLTFLPKGISKDENKTVRSLFERLPLPVVFF